MLSIKPKSLRAVGQSEIEPLLTKLESIVLGKTEQLRLAVCCMLAGGHLLIEDEPGTGKTVMAHALATVFGLQFQRVQFTNDLLPSDILGCSVFHRDKGEFQFQPGPIFNQIVLADEINRATPKTQSALLEAMEEHQVTIDGRTRPLPAPFYVIATQNPQDQFGTFPLPEAQLDRFLMRLELGYPDKSAELALYAGKDRRQLLAELQAETGPSEIEQWQKQVLAIDISDALYEYVHALVNYTRESSVFQNGLSPRAGLAMIVAAKAFAWMEGSTFVLPAHVQKILTAVVGHRLRFFDEGVNPRRAGQELLDNVAIP
ncbi:AAA family ATPase [Gammaproteobacteria bacterium 45_16_T64]|nr:AAA family ATPase [Gammaproteobacteria bacterium 45_16_T64]